MSTDRLIAERELGSKEKGTYCREQLYLTEDGTYRLQYKGEKNSRYGIVDKHEQVGTHGEKELELEDAKDFVKKVFGRIPGHLFKKEPVTT